MMFIQFLKENPIIDGFIFLIFLITVVPAVAAIYRRVRPAAVKAQAAQQKRPTESRFLGTQMDLAILVVGLLVLGVLISWVMTLF